MIRRGAAAVVKVSEDAIADAMRIYYEDCHALAEGAGAAPLAAALSAAKPHGAPGRIGIVLSGGNIDRPVYAEVLAGRTPSV